MNSIIKRTSVVLELIPYDRWVGASEISKKTGITSHKVSGIIKSRLLYKFVERKKVKTKYGKNFCYRRVRLY